MTVNHVRGVELVLPDGSVVETGGVTEDNPGYDLTGLIVGNEGTFGVVTKVTVGLTRDPEAGRTLLGVFDERRRGDRDGQRDHRRRDRARRRWRCSTT